MNTVDLLLIALLLAGLTFGYERGFWLTVFEYLGVIAGLVSAAVFAPIALDRLAIEQFPVRVAFIVIVLSMGLAIGGVAGRFIGEPIREVAHRVRLAGVADNVAGALLTGLVSVAAIWYLALSFSNGPSPELAREIQGSTLLRRLDAFAPRPPAALARLERELSGEFFPQVFAGLQPPVRTDVGRQPDAVQTTDVERAARSTVKVQAPGCGGISVGSGFVIAPERVMTNAHVVSGARSVSIVPEGTALPSQARVVYFDPKRDVAVLHVPGLRLPALEVADAQRGTQVAIIGYPGGGEQRTEPGVIADSLVARGRDIFGEALVNRRVWVVQGAAEHGNSGGPLVDASGRMVGVIFAASLSDRDQVFALARSEVDADIAAARDATAPVDMRDFACVS